MRIAVLADIHGNLHALEAVLADLRACAPDLVVNLGDHLSGPLEAARAADILMAQRDWAQIRGNHDRQMIGQVTEAMGLSDRAAVQELTNEHKAWLRSLPAAAVVAEDVLLCHGTPERDFEYLLEDVSTFGVSLASRDQIRSRLGGATGMILCGHSHVPRFVRLDGGTAVLNPGSVGLQAYYDMDHPFPHGIETGSPHARYALLDRTGSGWHAAFHAVDYDWNAAAQIARAGGRPDWEYALLTGYALR